MYTRTMDTQSKKPPRVTERDRDYMRRLGEWIAEGNAERLRQHLARTPKERLEDSLRLSAEYRTPEAIRRHLEEDDPSPLYERAKRLGLYRP